MSKRRKVRPRISRAKRRKQRAKTLRTRKKQLHSTSPLRSIWLALRALLKFVWKSFLVVAPVVGVAAAMGFLFGRFWPTDPVIELGEPSYSEAFEIPFTVRNRSVLFALENPRYGCILDVVATADLLLAGLNYRTSGTTIPPDQSRFMDCRFVETGNTPVEQATIRIETTRTMPWPFESSTRETIAGPFMWRPDLDPPRWVEGGESLSEAFPDIQLPTLE